MILLFCFILHLLIDSGTRTKIVFGHPRKTLFISKRSTRPSSRDQIYNIRVRNANEIRPQDPRPSTSSLNARIALKYLLYDVKSHGVCRADDTSRTGTPTSRARDAKVLFVQQDAARRFHIVATQRSESLGTESEAGPGRRREEDAGDSIPSGYRLSMDGVEFPC